ncbi:MAG TPA: serine/threonine-protein kinase [Polyangia bacterium]|nr:serine/threonine-protein kinase [Polyangia bacterium]
MGTLEDAARGREVGAESAARTGPTLPAIIGSKYRPVRLIAKGGMGAVYEVVHAHTGQHLALKLMLARSLLAPDLVERFRREARIHSAVKSEHVVRVVDADVATELDDAPFLVMELLEGRDFERLCLERQPSKAEVLDWLRQLALALDEAHQDGIVHRDLKPENVFLADRERGLPPIVKILDFGIAKMDGEGGAGNSTATGQILGTPRYMAPEQAMGAKHVTASADRFALGLIAFRLLSGRHYFQGDNWVALLRDVARGAQARPSAMGTDLGATFDSWFARACAFRPEDRFASAAEQIEELARALAGRASGRFTARRVTAIGAAVASAALVSVWSVVHRRGIHSPVMLARPVAGPLATAPPSPNARLPAAAALLPADPPPAATQTARKPLTHKRQQAGVRSRVNDQTPSHDGVWDEP